MVKKAAGKVPVQSVKDGAYHRATRTGVANHVDDLPFTFVPNIDADSIDGEAEIAPGFVICRANVAEGELIRRELESMVGSFRWRFLKNRWEAQPVPPKKGQAYSWRSISDPLRFKYSVIKVARRDGGDGNALKKFSDACALHHLAPKISISLSATTVFNMRPSFLNDIGAGTGAYDIATIPRLFDLSDVRVDLIQETAKRMSEHDNAIVDLNRFVQMKESLGSLIFGTPMHFVGHFALLEFLITHSPTNDSNSIGHQLKSKLALLWKKFEPALPPTIHQKSGDFVTPVDSNVVRSTWKAMYLYRNRIAHGGEIDFKNREIRELKDNWSAAWLVTETATAVARVALRDPHLVADLKIC